MIDLKKAAENKFLDSQTEGFDRMAQVLPEAEKGVARLDHFTMDPADTLASIVEHEEEFVPLGRYARLKVNGKLMMTDTPMERRTNLEVVSRARGRVLIAGLGLGMILRPILRKPEVTQITVLERYQDVVDMILPSLAGDSLLHGFESHDGNHVMVGSGRLEVIVADVFQWLPPINLPKFHTIYFDIWPNSTVGNLPEIHALHKRYRPLLAKGGWMSSWTYKKLQQKQIDDERFYKALPSLLEKHFQSLAPETFAERMRHLLSNADDRILTERDRQIIHQFAASKGVTLQPLSGREPK